MPTRQPSRKLPSGRRSGGTSSAAGSRKRASRTDSRRASTQQRGGTAAAAASRSRKRATKSASRRRGWTDALSLLKQDHAAVDRLFRDYDRMSEGDERKRALLATILGVLESHAEIEEEIFYPALRAAFEAGGMEKALGLLDEADVEHETIEWLMEQFEIDRANDGMTDARVKVMGEYVRQHAAEEEKEIFKAARRASLDLEALGAKLAARKRTLDGVAPKPADQTPDPSATPGQAEAQPAC